MSGEIQMQEHLNSNILGENYVLDTNFTLLQM
jgi:hypothetical protein